MRTPQLGVVRVMVVVRALPNAARAEHQNPKDFHQAVGQTGTGQDGPMLLIVINDKKTENEQPGENTADHLSGPMKIPNRPRKGNRQEKRCRDNIPPTPHRGFLRVRLGCQYEFFSCSHIRCSFHYSRLNRFHCRKKKAGTWSSIHFNLLHLVDS